MSAGVIAASFLETVAGGGVASNYPAEVLADSPLAYYRLGEASGTSMVDSSGNARNGTYTNATLGATKVVASSNDPAVSFDGTGYGDVPEAAWMKPAAITYEVWVRPTSVAAGNRFLIGRSNLQSLSDANYQAYLFQRGGVGFSFTVNSAVGGVLDLHSPDTTLAAGQVYHVVGTYDGATARLYVNGTEVASAAKTGALSSGGTNPLRVGSVNYGGYRFVGAIDEAAIYNTALSAARVTAHYQAALDPYAKTVLTDSPLAYYRLGEASGTTMVDSSGNGRNGTYNMGSPTPTTGLVANSPDSAKVFDGNDGGSTTFAAWQDPAAFTVEALVKTTATGANYVVARDNGSSRAWQFRLGSGDLSFVKIAGGVATYTGTPATPLNDGAVHHVAATYDGTTLRLYADGVQIFSTSMPSPAGAVDPLQVGWCNGGGFFNGTVDEAAYYGTALSAARVKEHALAALSPYAREVMTDAPVAYYRLGEASGTTATDASGNGRHGTYTGSSGPTKGATGVVVGDTDKAVSFGRTSQERVTLPSTGFPTGASPYTLEAWVKPTFIDSRQGIIKLGKHTVSNQANSLRLGISGSTPQIINYWWAADLTVTATGLVPGVWHHIVVTWDGTTRKIYLNSHMVGTDTPVAPNVVSDNLRIGLTATTVDGVPSDEQFAGDIDEVAVYSTALSAARVTAHYQAALSPYAKAVLADTPAAYFRLNEVSGTTMTDASGNGRHGTYTGSPTLQSTGLVSTDSDKAVDFNGTSQYGDVPYGSWMQPAAWTVEAFIKPDAVTRAGGGLPIMARHHSTQYQYWMLMLSGSKLAFEGRIGTSDTTAVVVTGATTLAVGTKYHVAATFDGTNVRIYLNGVLEATGSAGAAGSPPTIDFAIGALTDGYAIGSGWAFDGVIDEVAVYGAALSAARIAAHYQAAA